MIRSVPLNAQDIWINIEADALEKQDRKSTRLNSSH